MTALWILVAIVFVVAVLAWLAYGLFELSPFARHTERFRDAYGRRTGGSPHLETRDEFERRTTA
jgi:hypothetical protein